MIDKFGSPCPLTLDFIDIYFKEIDRLLNKYLSFSTLHCYFSYLSHSSRQILKSNFRYGWLPRIRKGGTKQMALFLLWAANYRQIIRYPFIMSKPDCLWKCYSQFLGEWSEYLESAPHGLREILDIEYASKTNSECIRKSHNESSVDGDKSSEVHS